MGTRLEQLDEFANIAKYWAISKQWPGRPWKVGNFPLPPYCSTRRGTQQVTGDRLNFCKYQYRCPPLRNVIAAFPDILRHPEIRVNVDRINQMMLQCLQQMLKIRLL
jgi:hypothetical protein